MLKLKVQEEGGKIVVALRDADGFKKGSFVNVPILDGKGVVSIGRLSGEERYAAAGIEAKGVDRASVEKAAREYAAEADVAFESAKGLSIGEADAPIPASLSARADEVLALYKAVALPPRRTNMFVESEIKAVHEDDGSVDIVLGSKKLDRQRETMDPMGLYVPNPKRVPLVSSHNYSDLQHHIGDLRNIKPDEASQKVHARAEYFHGMGNPEADWGWTLAKMGHAAYSVGFLPMKWVDADLSDEKTLNDVLEYKKPLRHHEKWELMEGSHVIVPANRDAVQRMVKAGIIPADFAKGMTLSDAPMSEAALKGFERALEEYAAVRKEAEQWKVAGKRGLPLDDGPWDQDEAHRTLDQEEGGDANHPRDRGDADRNKPGQDHKDAHVIHDANAPEEHRSYKLQFAKKVKAEDGEFNLVASRKALRKIRDKISSLNKGGKDAYADIPDESLDGIKRFLKSYGSEFDPDYEEDANQPGANAGGTGEGDTDKGIDIIGLFELKAGEEWRVGGGRGLPLDEESSWDAGEAEKSLKGGDEEPSARYRRGHIVFNAAASDKFGSYKLPFAKVSGGKMVAVKRGLEAARGRLNQTDIPSDVKESAGRFIDSYLGAEEKGEVHMTVTVDAEQLSQALADAAQAMTRSFDDGIKKMEARVAEIATKAAREAFGPDSAAHQKTSDLIAGVGKAVRAIVDESIAKAKGNVDAWRP